MENFVKYGRFGELYIGMPCSEIVKHLGRPDFVEKSDPICWSYEGMFMHIHENQVLSSLEIYIDQQYRNGSNLFSIEGIEKISKMSLSQFCIYLENLGVEPEKVQSIPLGNGIYEAIKFPPLTKHDESILLKSTFTNGVIDSISSYSLDLLGTVSK